MSHLFATQSAPEMRRLPAFSVAVPLSSHCATSSFCGDQKLCAHRTNVTTHKARARKTACKPVNASAHGNVAAALLALASPGLAVLPIPPPVSRPVSILDRFRPKPPAPSQTAAPARRVSTSFVTAAVRSVGAAVVRIDTERLITGHPGILLHPSPDSDGSLMEDPLFKKFFGEYYGKQKTEPRRKLVRGQGSGFITSKDGLLITNAHVVKGAEKVTVTLTDGRAFEGVVKGTDDLLDLAVVKIDPKGTTLPVAPLGNSSDLQVGDWVIAVGNPVGLDNTVTLGIVSSLNRTSAEVGIPEKRLSLIQTSAPLNLGNSGGPLLNEFGEVVGINTAVRANAEAIGFAIPIDRAKDIALELAKGKTIAHAFVGIRMTTLTPGAAKQNNENPNAPAVIPEVEGALVTRVVPSSPAADGGIRRFDIIVEMDGKKVRNAKDAQAIVDKSRVGQSVNFKVIRGDPSNFIDIAVKTGDLADLQNGKLQKAPVPVLPNVGDSVQK